MNMGPMDRLAVSDTAHLLAQIGFLHKEVERLEVLLTQTRAGTAREHKDIVQSYESVIEHKNSELRQLQQSVSQRNSSDLRKRCQLLEKQLAAVNAERNTLSMEQSDLRVTIQKLESSLKGQKSELSSSKRLSSEVRITNQDQVSKLTQALQTMAYERAALESDLLLYRQMHAPEKRDAETNTTSDVTNIEVFTQTAAAITAEKHCQVDSSMHFAQSSEQSLNQLYHALEEKTRECDALRTQLEDISVAQVDTTVALKNTKKRLEEESELRRQISEDTERLSIQMRSLQQKSSEQSATERDLVAKIHALEEQRQQMHTIARNSERDQHGRDAQLRQYEKDMEQLVANKNFANQQLCLLSNENENLRLEVQRLLQREAQLAFSLKAKDGELQELLGAYQSSVRENENVVGSQRILEREMDNLRAALASKEDGVIYLQEQLSGVHRREQQLLLDLQTFEYENDQLHRKILQSEEVCVQWEVKVQQLQQLQSVKERMIEELHQNLAELSKQIVVTENETMLMRRHRESLEGDIKKLRNVAVSESTKSRHLEETNARLLTHGVLTSSEYVGALQRKLEYAEKQHESLLKNKKEGDAALQDAVAKKMSIEGKLHHTEEQLKEALQSNDRLQKIVLDQMQVLSHLSK